MSAPVISEAELLAGFEDARERFRVAVETGQRVPGYRALFEALNWAVSLDYLIQARLSGKWWGQRSGGQVVRAVRFVRNRAHHQWSEAVTFEVIGVLHADTILQADTILAADGHTAWRWRPVADLPVVTDPKFADPKGERLYERLLAGQPSQDALTALSGLFSGVVTTS